MLPEFEANLAAQQEAVNDQDVDRFHALDFTFHQLLCRCAHADAAFDIIVEQKSQMPESAF
ncbi:FCD domain-containing protein [Pelagimonas varians]|uniref:GntR C-terminal domain-containing protein n=1 Tax=Pelagimonas varians TaxID=696760 RepID=A0A238L649_9RHOB|nr:FCD domain-containing protein [Pelagimonas varians]SMX50291.1 hypothetical protein PEV8663_04585 [Pelagimonas varians]